MKRILITIPLLVVFACSSDEQTKKPPSLIEKERFVPLVVDLKVLEEHYHRLFVRPDIYSASLDSASSFIFEDHETTKDEFEQSLLYYCQNILVIYEIFETALDTINLRVTDGGTNVPDVNPVP